MTRFNLLKNLFAILMTLSLASVCFAQDDAGPAREATDDDEDCDDCDDEATLVVLRPGGMPASAALPLVTGTVEIETVEEVREVITVVEDVEEDEDDEPTTDPNAECVTTIDCTKCIDGYRYSHSLGRCIPVDQWNYRYRMQQSAAFYQEHGETLMALPGRMDAAEGNITTIAEAVNDLGGETADLRAMDVVHDQKIKNNTDLALQAIGAADREKKRNDAQDIAISGLDTRMNAQERRPDPRFDLGLSGMFHSRRAMADRDGDDNHMKRLAVAGYFSADMTIGLVSPSTGIGGCAVLGGGIGPNLAVTDDHLFDPAVMVYALGGVVFPINGTVLELMPLIGFSWEATGLRGNEVLSESRNLVGGLDMTFRSRRHPVHPFLRITGGGGTANTSFIDDDEVTDLFAPTWYVGVNLGLRIGPEGKVKIDTAVAAVDDLDEDPAPPTYIP